MAKSQAFTSVGYQEAVLSGVDLGSKLGLNFHQQYVGTAMSVLWEMNVGADNNGLRWVGYTDNYIRVHANGPTDLFNRVTQTQMVEASANGLNGRLQHQHER